MQNSFFRNSVLALRASADWVRPIQIMEDNVLYSKLADMLITSKKYLHDNIQIDVSQNN